MRRSTTRPPKPERSVHRPAPSPERPKSEVPASARRTVDLPLALILLGAATLRLLSLDYSHFQGDEIKALYPPGASFPDFLLAQKKGPVQFLVTLVIRTITGGYVEWQTRLPFALVSLLGVYVLYRLVCEQFGRRSALYAAALVGSCGLLVAFGRVVQYQAFCMLFILLSAYLLFRILRSGEALLLYPALTCYALAVLTHYDGLTFAPTLVYLVALAVRRRGGWTRPFFFHLAWASALALMLAGLFYVPYLLQPQFPDVGAYLFARVASGEGLGTFAATYQLLGLYLPPLYLVFTIPLLGYGAVVVCRERGSPQGLVILAWFVTTFAFYMFLGGDPRSHVYTYFLPGLILVAIGLDKAFEAGEDRAATIVLQASAWGIIMLFAGATYYMIVDHRVEHPWYRKTILGFELPNLVTRRVEGVFGFPYRRGLDKVGTLFQSGRLRGNLATNERDVMADYYFSAQRSNLPDYYILVLRPLSLDRDLPLVVARSYRLIETVAVGERPTIEIYEAPWRVSSARLGSPPLSTPPRLPLQRGGS